MGRGIPTKSHEEMETRIVQKTIFFLKTLLVLSFSKKPPKKLVIFLMYVILAVWDKRL